ncbi:MAG TPA: tetratricopeptide repeat protein [Opitutaceae bacterium]|jgi:Flp pilus assembly protein TadD|nr:tetratricopeptide repeat protein [Opitutaceae bacterium]
MRARLALAAAAILAIAGCRAKQVTTEERNQALLDASDADFAVTIHDMPRAEGMFAKAVELCPDEGDVWLKLAVVRMQLKNPDGARQAYKSALSAFKDASKAHPADSSLILRRAYILVILGRGDEGRRLVEDAAAKAPDDHRLQAFIQAKGLDKMLADPSVKQISP